jgi:hypothetical protein
LDATIALSLQPKDDLLLDKFNYHHSDGVVLEILSFSEFGARCRLQVALLFSFGKEFLICIRYANFKFNMLPVLKFPPLY